MASNQIRREDFQLPLSGLLRQFTRSNVTLFHAIDTEITQLEQTALTEIGLDRLFGALKNIKGVGNILGMTIMLETGTIKRFENVGNYASYCRCVNSVQMSTN